MSRGAQAVVSTFRFTFVGAVPPLSVYDYVPLEAHQADAPDYISV